MHSSSNIIEVLEVGDTKTISLDKRIFGLGKITISATVYSTDSGELNLSQDGFILGPLIF